MALRLSIQKLCRHCTARFPLPPRLIGIIIIILTLLDVSVGYVVLLQYNFMLWVSLRCQTSTHDNVQK